jgi:hypothetical protein
MVATREANSKLLDFVPEWQSVRPEAGARRASFEGPVREEEFDVERAAELLDAIDMRRAPEFIATLIDTVAQRRGGAGVNGLGRQRLLQALTRLSARAVRALGSQGALHSSSRQELDRMAETFGLESEGLSAEDRELELARQLVRFITSAAENLRRTTPDAGPDRSVLTALRLAAQKHAPGWLPLFATTHHI